MSREHEIMYRLEQKRREEIERKRAAEFSEKAYKEICARYEQMKKAEYDSYIPDEMNEISRSMNQITNLLKGNVFEARNLCYSVQASLSQMKFLFSSAKEEFERKEKIRYEEIQREKERAKSKLEEAFYKQLSEIKSSAAANFAIQDLENVKAKIQSGKIVSEAELEQQMKNAFAIAEEKAKKWKEEKLAKEKVSILLAQIDDTIKSAENEKFENSEKKNSFIKKIASIKNSIDENSSKDEVESKLSEIRSSMDNAIIDEEVRRETVKAIVKELRAQEFTVEKPQIFGSGKDSYVLVKAKKPSGKQAVCKINLEGKLKYRFDNYEGMTCLRDIEKFNIDLEKIYSVKFSDERVIWENPDRLSRAQEVAADSNRRNM